MLDYDLPEFTRMLDATCALMTRGTYTPNDTSTEIFFAALAEFDIATVRAAFGTHVRTSRFAPTPADIRDAIEKATGGDGRPASDEAWAIAVQAVDEAGTVVWTREIAQAWGLAEPAYEARNTTGARMAFRDCYERLVAEARQRREPVTWLVSEGHDPERRRIAAEAAVAAGRLTQAQAGPLLAAPTRAEPVALLAGPAAGGKAPPEIAARLQALRDKLAQPRDFSSPAVHERERAAAAKAEAERLVAEHTRTPA